MFRDLVPLGDVTRFRLLRQLFQQRCLRICATSVRGSAGTLTRFHQDLARAQEIFGCAGVVIQAAGFMEVVDNTLLDQTGWTPAKQSADATRLLEMGPACGRSERFPPTVYAYYVRTLGDAYNGIGRPNFANNAPGLVVSDEGNSNTFAHEVGHVLGLNPVDHDPDSNNIMYFDSPNITSDPPVITAAQCNIARRSPILQTCPSVFDIPAARVPRVFRRPPFEATPALQGLLSDEPSVVERFAARGQAILPDLLSRVNDPDPAIRARVLAVLARISNPMALQAVELAARTDPRPSIRATAAQGLAESGTLMAGPILTRALQDTDPGVRAAAVRSLAQAPALGSLMNIGLVAARDVDPNVRLLASRIAMLGR